jgi:hypothetical protein
MCTPSALREPRSGTASVGQVPGRGDWVAAWLLLVLCAAAAVMTAAALVRAQEPRQPAAIPAPPPAYTSGEVAAATAKTCAVWWTASEAMNNAANAVNDTPGPVGWDNPVRQEARDREADVSLTQTAYLKNQVDPATPAELRRLLDQYHALTFAELDASVHRLGTQVDALIEQQNSVMRGIDSMCGK